MSDADVYRELCNSYRAIDEFRTKLLGLLPLVTAGGVIGLFGKDVNFTIDKLKHLEPVAIFGLLISLGLYAYELHGITKCQYLVETGKSLERRADIPGQFAARPVPPLYALNKPFAAAIIYPAVLAAWIFVAVLIFNLVSALIAAFVVFLSGFSVTILYARSLNARCLKDNPEWKNS